MAAILSISSQVVAGAVGNSASVWPLLLWGIGSGPCPHSHSRTIRAWVAPKTLSLAHGSSDVLPGTGHGIAAIPDRRSRCETPLAGNALWLGLRNATIRHANGDRGADTRFRFNHQRRAMHTRQRICEGQAKSGAFRRIDI